MDSNCPNWILGNGSILKCSCTTVVGCCTFTQSSSFIHFAKSCIVSSCIISYLNQYACSQFCWWMLQPCFVLKSWPQKKQMNLIICIIFKIIFDNCFKIFFLGLVSRFGLSVVGLCSSGHFPAITSDCLSLNIFIRDQKRFSQSLLQSFIQQYMGRYSLSLYLPLDGSPRFTSRHF